MLRWLRKRWKKRRKTVYYDLREVYIAVGRENPIEYPIFSGLREKEKKSKCLDG